MESRSQRWFEKNWKVNSLGYRDIEHDSYDNRQIIFVVGDSFVAGHGIARPGDRFSDLLQKRLGDRYVVVNIAQNGWNTPEEYQAIISYPRKPNRIILSYFINDITDAAKDRMPLKCSYEVVRDTLG